MNIPNILTAIDAEIRRLQRAREALSVLDTRTSHHSGRGPKRLSAAARARISRAQKARWAKIKAAKR